MSAGDFEIHRKLDSRVEGCGVNRGRHMIRSVWKRLIVESRVFTFMVFFFFNFPMGLNFLIINEKNSWPLGSPWPGGLCRLQKPPIPAEAGLHHVGWVPVKILLLYL